MEKQVFNPYLPNDEYVPDGEPHVFGSRVYVYGSHDRFNGKAFCVRNYVCWSAPVDDLTDWRFEGEIYRSVIRTDIYRMQKRDFLPRMCKKDRMDGIICITPLIFLG